MSHSDGIQAATLLHKMQLFMGAAIESFADNDEALWKRDAQPATYGVGYDVTIPADLSYYESTGRGTPWTDRLIERAQDAQAQEWARQYPQRQDMHTCAREEGEHSQEAQEWQDAALQGETIYLQLEIEHKGDSVEISAGFTDEINAPYTVMWRGESLSACEFMALDDTGLDSLIKRLCDAPYWSIVTKQDESGKWRAWLGTGDGKTAHYLTAGHATESAAFERVKWGVRS